MSNFKFISIWLCVFCVFVFILQLIFPVVTDTFVLSKTYYYEFWRLFSSIFLHGSLSHLIYNIFALALFGSILESIIGSKKILGLFLVSGIFANIFSVFFYDSSLGASGAIFGVIGTLAVLRPKMSVWVYSLPMPMFLASILWIGGDLFGAVAFLTGNPISNTGNIAHLGGVFIGIFYGILVKNRFIEKAKEKEKIYLNETGMQNWEDHFMR